MACQLRCPASPFSLHKDAEAPLLGAAPRKASDIRSNPEMEKLSPTVWNNPAAAPCPPLAAHAVKGERPFVARMPLFFLVRWRKESPHYIGSVEAGWVELFSELMHWLYTDPTGSRPTIVSVIPGA